MKLNPSSYQVLQISSFPPRECGIATFTQDLVFALNKKFNPVVKTRVVALNDQPTSIYNYSKLVTQEISATDLGHYVRLAQEINRRSDVKLVNIQHEFGLFGGEWGDFIIPFLQALQKPAIVTFHCVLPNPDEHLRKVVSSIAEFAKVIVVMNTRSAETLETDYALPKSKLALIPHGIPQVVFETSDKAKQELGLEGKMVLSTFGHLSQDKGVEYAIRALPQVVKQFPNLLYIVIGATHPNIQREYGEAYRNFLIAEVKRLGLGEHVKFYNKYLTIEEVVTYLKATDIYISPSINVGQSVSGTLAYALGCGRPIISTATEYAKYIIDESNGALVKPKTSSGITRALLDMLSDQKYMKAMSATAYEKSRTMIWPNVAAEYFNLYKKFADVRSEETKLPELKFDHLLRLTDERGVMHHARYAKPERRFGYSLDDNARALLAAAKRYVSAPSQELLSAMHTYLRYIKFVSKPSGYFSNIVSSQGRPDKTNTEDVLGRTVAALGFAASHPALPTEIQTEAKTLLAKPLRVLGRLTSPRAIAFAMTGLATLIERQPQFATLRTFKTLAERQYGFYAKVASADWRWFEEQLTYSNSKLPESLYCAYTLLKQKKYLKAAEESLDFLRGITFRKEYYVPIGQNGWYFRDKARAYFDQQPEDAATMVETKMVAWKTTGNKKHLADAFRTFQWFLGKNHLNQMVYDEVTGGCHDGLGQYAMNLNQGAESTISYLLARLALEDADLPTIIH